MVRRWGQWKSPWEREYAMRGRLWRGATDAGYVAQWILPTGKRVLELGCGDGKFLRGLQDAGHHALGVDAARRALRLAQVARPSPLVQADIRVLPFPSASFSSVIARHVLGALGELGRRRAADEMERVARTGAAILVEEFTPEDFRYGRGREVETGTFERNRGILTHYFVEDEIPRLFAGSTRVHFEHVLGRQRTSEGVKERHRARWVLRRQSPEEPNASSRVAGGRTS